MPDADAETAPADLVGRWMEVSGDHGGELPDGIAVRVVATSALPGQRVARVITALGCAHLVWTDHLAPLPEPENPLAAIPEHYRLLMARELVRRADHTMTLSWAEPANAAHARGAASGLYTLAVGLAAPGRDTDDDTIAHRDAILERLRRG